MKPNRLLAFLVTFSFLAVAATEASTISINFAGQGGVDNPGPVTGTAGAIDVGNWNNTAISQNDGPLALNDSDGNPTGATVNWSVANHWTTNGGDTGGGNAQMMQGYLDNLQDRPPITISGIPAAYQASGYDVRIYHNTDSGGTMGFIVNDGATSLTYYSHQAGGNNSNFPLGGVDPFGGAAGFIGSQATNPDTRTPSNYTLFTGLTGADLTITPIRGSVGDTRVRPNAIQITQVPVSNVRVGGRLLVDLNYQRGMTVEVDAASGEERVIAWKNSGSMGGSFVRNIDSPYKTFGLGTGNWPPPFLADKDGIRVPNAPGGRCLVSDVRTPAALAGRNSWSVETWFWKNNDPTDGRKFIAWTENQPDDGLNAGKFGHGPWAAQHSASQGVGGIGDLQWDAATGLAPTSNAWHHAVFTYDGAVEKVYVDGVHTNSQTIELNISPLEYYPIIFSGLIEAQPAQTSFSYNGAFAAVRIHSDALTSVEVATNFGLGKTSLPADEAIAVEIAPVTDFNADGATLNGNLVLTNDIASTSVKFFWGSTDGGRNAAAWENTVTVNAPEGGAGTFSKPILAPGGDFFCRAFAKNKNGSAWSSAMPFTVVPSPKNITTFTFDVFGAATISGTKIFVLAPAGATVTGISGAYAHSGASATPPSPFSNLDFTTPQNFTVTGTNGESKTYTVEVVLPVTVQPTFLPFLGEAGAFYAPGAPGWNYRENHYNAGVIFNANALNNYNVNNSGSPAPIRTDDGIEPIMDHGGGGRLGNNRAYLGGGGDHFTVRGNAFVRFTLPGSYTLHHGADDTTYTVLNTADGTVTAQNNCCGDFATPFTIIKVGDFPIDFVGGEEGGGDWFEIGISGPGIAGVVALGDTGNGSPAVFTMEKVTADTDGDGLPDAYETLYGLDPNSAEGVNGASGDPDADGLTNINEKTAGTKANVADTDGDGLSDGAEVNTSSTNPLLADTDKDGLSDGAEVNTHQSNPKLADTDGDGVADGIEVANGTSPATANSGPAFGLYAYWPMDDDFVSTKGGFSATPVNGPTLVPGKFGNAVYLDGNNQHLRADGDENNFDFAGKNFSVSAWYTAESLTKSWQCLIAKGEGGGWRLHRRGGEGVFAFTGGSPGDINSSAPLVVDPDTFHHVVCVVKAEGGYKIYIDGALTGEGGGTAYPENRGNPMMIGENPDAAGRTWHGKVDDVAFWSRSLSDDDIAQIYDEGRGRSIGDMLSPLPLDFTQVQYSTLTNKWTLAWDSKPGRTYTLKYSSDLLNFDNDIDDTIPSGGSTTTYGPFESPLLASPRLFLRVIQNP